MHMYYVQVPIGWTVCRYTLISDDYLSDQVKTYSQLDVYKVWNRHMPNYIYILLFLAQERSCGDRFRQSQKAVEGSEG